MEKAVNAVNIFVLSFLPAHANFGLKRRFCANTSRLYTYFSVFTTNRAPAVPKKC